MSFPFDIAEVAQPVSQSLQRWPGLIRENADFPKVARRLRSDGSWPRRCRAAEQRDELAPFHCPIPPVLPTENSTPRYGKRLLRCGISARLMTAVGQTRLTDKLPTSPRATAKNHGYLITSWARCWRCPGGNSLASAT